MTMTIQEIKEALESRCISLANHVDSVAERYGALSLAQMERRLRDGLCSQDDYETYCYLWRNTKHCWSYECIGYQLS